VRPNVEALDRDGTVRRAVTACGRQSRSSSWRTEASECSSTSSRQRFEVDRRDA
jgi:hypothetical protein